MIVALIICIFGFYFTVYYPGHGGDGFLKFQDAEEITNVELADAFEQMWQKRRYARDSGKWVLENS